MKPIDLTKIFCTGDGSHCGLADWYQDKEAALLKALRSGKPFVTGWYSSKKEIASAQIEADKTQLWVKVSVSDDFDTEGIGDFCIKRPKKLEPIRQALYRAWDLAEMQQKENRTYCGYSIGLRSGKKHRGWKRLDWCETYLVDISSWCLDAPGGDNYHKWGWQDEDSIKVTDQERKLLEDGMLALKPIVFVGDYVAEQWDHKEEL